MLNETSPLPINQSQFHFATAARCVDVQLTTASTSQRATALYFPPNEKINEDPHQICAMQLNCDTFMPTEWLKWHQELKKNVTNWVRQTWVKLRKFLSSILKTGMKICDTPYISSSLLDLANNKFVLDLDWRLNGDFELLVSYSTNFD